LRATCQPPTKQITAPLLIIHGENDENPGTAPFQSKYLYAALKGLGKVARYVVLPRESHKYNARVSLMHTLWEVSGGGDAVEWGDDDVCGSNPALHLLVL
jgi:hypothetical protein